MLIPCPVCNAKLDVQPTPIEDDFIIQRYISVPCRCHRCGWTGELGFSLKFQCDYFDEEGRVPTHYKQRENWQKRKKYELGYKEEEE